MTIWVYRRPTGGRRMAAPASFGTRGPRSGTARPARRESLSVSSRRGPSAAGLTGQTQRASMAGCPAHPAIGILPAPGIRIPVRHSGRPAPTSGRSEATPTPEVPGASPVTAAGRQPLRPEGFEPHLRSPPGGRRRRGARARGQGRTAGSVPSSRSGVGTEVGSATAALWAELARLDGSAGTDRSPGGGAERKHP